MKMSFTKEEVAEILAERFSDMNLDPATIHMDYFEVTIDSRKAPDVAVADFVSALVDKNEPCIGEAKGPVNPNCGVHGPAIAGERYESFVCFKCKGIFHRVAGTAIINCPACLDILAGRIKDA